MKRSLHSGLLSDSCFALSAGTRRDSCFALRRSESQSSGRDDIKGRAALIGDHPPLVLGDDGEVTVIGNAASARALAYTRDLADLRHAGALHEYASR
jgi:hypothetical protein